MTPVAPEGGAVRPGRRLRVGVAALALVLVVVGLASARSGITDPYRPGTSHRVRVTTTPCGVAEPDPLVLDGRRWTTSDPAPSAWWEDGGRPIPGRLDVVADDDAVFTAERGGMLRYHRLPAGTIVVVCPFE